LWAQDAAVPQYGLIGQFEDRVHLSNCRVYELFLTLPSPRCFVWGAADVSALIRFAELIETSAFDHWPISRAMARGCRRLQTYGNRPGLE
jgi:hypothetical protein